MRYRLLSGLTALAAASAASAQPITEPPVYHVYLQDQFASGVAEDRFWLNASLPMQIERETDGDLLRYRISPAAASVAFDDLGTIAGDFTGNAEIRVVRDRVDETLAPLEGDSPLTGAMRDVIEQVRAAEGSPAAAEDADGYRFSVDLPLGVVLPDLQATSATCRVRVQRVETTLGRLWFTEWKVAPTTVTTARGDVVVVRHEGFALLDEQRELLIAGGTRYAGQVVEAATGALVPFEGRRKFGMAPNPDEPEVLFDATRVAAIASLIRDYGNPADAAAAAEGDLTLDASELAAAPTVAEAAELVRNSSLPRWLGEVRAIATALDVLGSTAAESQANPLPMIALAGLPAVIDPMVGFGTTLHDAFAAEAEQVGLSPGLDAYADQEVALVYDTSDGGSRPLRDQTVVDAAVAGSAITGPAAVLAADVDFDQAAFVSIASAGRADGPVFLSVESLSPSVFGQSWVGTSVDAFAQSGLGRSTGIDVTRVEADRLTASARSARRAIAQRQQARAAVDPSAGLAPVYATSSPLTTSVYTTSPDLLNAQVVQAVATSSGTQGLTGSGGFIPPSTIPNAFGSATVNPALSFRVFDSAAEDGDIVRVQVQQGSNVLLQSDPFSMTNAGDVFRVNLGLGEAQLIVEAVGGPNPSTGAVELQTGFVADASGGTNTRLSFSQRVPEATAATLTVVP
jgi:hypothetical protein